MSIDNKNADAEKSKDSGLALVLICLVCYLIWRQPHLITAAIVLLLIAMTVPSVFKPFGILWFALSSGLGRVASSVILTILFFALVLPVGLVRRSLGKDSMQIKNWKKGHDSVFRKRNHTFSAEDLENPY